MEIGEKAVSFHREGFNCAQCVMLSMQDKTGLTEVQSEAVAEGFGGGVRCGEHEGDNGDFQGQIRSYKVP